jgi:hypothetical protein
MDAYEELAAEVSGIIAETMRDNPKPANIIFEDYGWL